MHLCFSVCCTDSSCCQGIPASTVICNLFTFSRYIICKLLLRYKDFMLQVVNRLGLQTLPIWNISLVVHGVHRNYHAPDSGGECVTIECDCSHACRLVIPPWKTDLPVLLTHTEALYSAALSASTPGLNGGQLLACMYFTPALLGQNCADWANVTGLMWSCVQSLLVSNDSDRSASDASRLPGPISDKRAVTVVSPSAKFWEIQWSFLIDGHLISGY